MPRVKDEDLEKLARAITTPQVRTQRPALVATVGLPGSGKSHFAHLLAQRLPLVVLESDALRSILFRKPLHSYKENRRLFRALHALAERLLAEGHTVLLDATNLREEHRLDLKHIADRLSCPLILVELTAPEGLLIQRLKGRESRPAQAGVEVYVRMRAEAEPILLEHRCVDSSRDITSAIEEIAGEIERL
ncbi:MAG: ATP-binding protein [Dehalococcoidia bacterium]